MWFIKLTLAIIAIFMAGAAVSLETDPPGTTRLKSASLGMAIALILTYIAGSL